MRRGNRKRQINCSTKKGKNVMEYSYNNRRNTSISDKEIHFVSRLSDEYPLRLHNIPNKPKGLYVIGKLPDHNKPCIAIIGARVCSEYGRSMAQMFGKACGKSGIQVISGMAKGIDGISQMATLEAGGTSFAILGCGVDICYPKENAALYRQLSEAGGIISEHEPGKAPLAQHFPSRNRIISGLADALLVIEAKEKSGTLITVDMALEQGRDVYALPGRVTDSMSAGCNHLIKQGASIVCSPEELLAELYEIKECWTEGTAIKSRKNDFLLDKEENIVYACLDLYAKNLEEIVLMTKLSVAELVHILFSLEMKGLIKESGKNYYIRLE